MEPLAGLDFPDFLDLPRFPLYDGGFSNIPEIDDFLISLIKFQNYFDPIITCSVEQGGEFLSDTDTLL